MAKSPAFDALFPMNGLVPPEAVRDYCDQTVKKAADLNRSLINSVSQAVDGNFELAGRLVRCSDPAEAISVYKDWLTTRRDAVLSESKELAAQWMKLCDVDLSLVATAARRATDQAAAQMKVSTLPRAAAGE